MKRRARWLLGVAILGMLGILGRNLLESPFRASAHDCPPPNCEDRHNLYVPGAGNVANAGTYGLWSGECSADGDGPSPPVPCITSSWALESGIVSVIPVRFRGSILKIVIIALEGELHR